MAADDGGVERSVLEAVAERAGTGVAVLDADLRFVYVNETAAAINGRSPEDHHGRRFDDLAPAMAATLRPMLEEVLATGEPVLHLEVSGSTAADPERDRWWDCSYVRLDGSEASGPLVVAVFVEVTALRASQQRLRRVVDSIFSFVGLLDTDGRLLEANAAALAVAALEPDDVIGTPFWEGPWWSHDPGVRDRVRQAVQQAAAGTSSRFDTWASVAGGALLPIDFQIVPLLEDGEITALVPSATDITARVDSARRLGAITDLATRLNRATTTDDVLREVVDAADAVVGASLANVGVVDRDAGILRLHQPDDVAPDVAERWVATPLGARSQLHDAVRQEEALVVVDQADRLQRYPEMADDAARLGLEATAAVPLRGPEGVQAVLGLGWRKPVHDTADLRVQLALVEELCGEALTRTRRADVQRELIDELRRELVDHRPALPVALDVAVGYESALDDVSFGGDWHDIVVVDDHTHAFVVGDVAGHGLAAASQMGVASGTLRGLITADPGLGRVVHLAGRALGHLGGGYVATAVMAVVDTEASRAWVLSAGHPPPLLRRPGGTAEVLWEGRGPVIGVPAAPVIEPSGVDLPVGSVLVLYTDGLIERRSEPIDDGIERLRAALAAAPSDLSAQATVDHLLGAMVDEETEDDVALVVVRHEPVESSAGTV